MFEKIPAFLRLRARYLPFEVQNEIAHILDKVEDVQRLEFAEHEQITARAAAHGTEINYLAPSLRTAQKCRAQMLYRMQGGDVRRGFAVRLGDTQVESRDRDPVPHVPAREIYPRTQRKMIYLKTRYLFHFSPLSAFQAVRTALARRESQVLSMTSVNSKSTSPNTK